MDSADNLSQTILKSSEPSSIFGSSTSSESGFFDSIKNINFTTWLLIILILAFLGFNIFVYLAKGTQDITNFFAPITQKLFGTAGSVAGQTVSVSAEGAKAVVGGVAGVTEAGLTGVQELASPSTIKQSQTVTKQQPDVMQQASLNRTLNASAQSQQQSDYEADIATSSIQGGGKAGWCYIGEDRGFRTCAQVGVNDTCMSGEIFPSHDICMNPSLRP